MISGRKSIQSFALRILVSRMASSSGPIEKAIIEALDSTFKPVHLEVINESYMHNVPKGSESHFKVLVVSKDFDGVTLIKVHINWH